jgi:hypothetical protein
MTQCAMARALRHPLLGQVRTASILRPYEPYLLERWRSGVHTGLKRWRAIVALGYAGTRGNGSRFVA